MKSIILFMIGVSMLFGASIVVDKNTGLQWQDNKDAKTVKKNWSDAQKYCQDLSLGGYSDWRLPSYNEILSIADYNKYSPAIKDGFENVVSDCYWSSTPYSSGNSYAWHVDFKDDYAFGSNKSSKHYVRCVRGGQ